MPESDVRYDTAPPGLRFTWQKTPGFWLGGRAANPPDDFASVDADRVAWVETRARLPYVVALGYLGLGQAVYLVALPRSRWYARLQRNPDVRLRIRDSVYRMRASVVEDDEELQRLIERYNVKYRDLIAEYYNSPYSLKNIRRRVVPVRLTPR